MDINPIKKAALTGKKIFGVHLTFPCPTLVEMLASQKLDFVYFDGEHGAFDLRDIEEGCRAAELAGLVPIARVPSILPHTVNQFLDRGIRGVIGPHVSTRDDAEQLARASYFSPLGERSWGDSRGERYAIGISSVPEHMAELNANISVGVMIEDRQAIDNLDAILAVDGIDYFNFGLQDLAQSLGYPGNPSHPNVRAVTDEVADRIHAAGKRLREDFMVFAWVRDVIYAGVRSLVTDRKK